MASLAAGLAGAATIDSLFEYNRANFRFDAGLRFERFQSGREYAIMQTNMYRADLRKMAELTSTKMNLYHVVGVTVMMLDMALIGAGRLGLHGPSPPGWMMCLFLTNNAASLAFMALTMWFAMHAACRCNACATHLLTRYVRVPVPTQHQLDQARSLSSDFEHMRVRDILRVPFIGADHPENIADPDYADKMEAYEKAQRGSQARSFSLPGRRLRRPPQEKRVPTWVRDEWTLDRAGGVTGPLVQELQNHGEEEAPEHFRMWSRAQAGWVPTEVYARLCMTYGVLHFLSALSFYSLGHINCELRSFYTSYSVPFVMMTAHAAICHFEFCRDSQRGNQYFPYFEFFGFFAPMFGAIAMSIEFRPYFSKAWITIGWLIVFIAYLCQLLYTLRLWDIAYPDTRSTLAKQGQVRDDTLGAVNDKQSGWWPSSWTNIPTGFRQVLYIVAPPKKLQEGQHDLLREMAVLAANGGNNNTLPRGFVAKGEELVLMAQELDDRFAWWFSEQGYWDRVSHEHQEQVRAIFHTYQETDGANEAARAAAIERAHDGLDRVERENNLDQATPGRDNIDSAELDAPQVGGPGHGSRNQPIPPWKAVILVASVLIFCWVLGIIGCTLEVILGEQFLVSHVMINPITRPNDYDVPLHHAEWHGGNPAGPGLDAAATEAIENAHVPPHHRRLTIWEKMAEERGKAVRPQSGPATEAQALEAIASLANALPGPDALAGLLQRPVEKGEMADLAKAVNSFGSSLSPTHAVDSLKKMKAMHAPHLQVHWPNFFEPKLLACQGESQGGVVAVMTPRGVGAAAHVNFDKMEMNWQTAETFTLTGLTEYSPILSATWGQNDDTGLLLVTREGDLLTCPGGRPKAGGHWACSTFSRHKIHSVPLSEGAVLHAAAASWVKSEVDGQIEEKLHVALLTGDALDLVAIYVLEGEDTWMPLGDVPVPRRPHEELSKVTLNFVGGDVIVATERGEVLQRRIADGVLVAQSPSTAQETKTMGGPVPRQWMGACGLPNGGVAHLALHKPSVTSKAWRPIVSTSGLVI